MESQVRQGLSIIDREEGCVSRVLPKMIAHYGEHGLGIGVIEYSAAATPLIGIDLTGCSNKRLAHIVHPLFGVKSEWLTNKGRKPWATSTYIDRYFSSRRANVSFRMCQN